MKKRVLSSMLSLAMLLSLMPGAAYAANDEALEAANALNALGMFSGVGTAEDGTIDYDLERTPTRQESITMLLSMMGKTEEAKAGEWTMPFTDVAEWAKPYVGYAYENGLTSGMTETTYGGENETTAAQYLTFVLTSLGYKSGEDFQWDKAWELSDELGITDGQYNADSEFTRGDMAIISYNALSAEPKVEIVSPIAELLDMSNRPEAPAEIPEGLEIDWGVRYHFDEIEDQIQALAEAYPEISELYSIGTSWEERDLWCIEITNEAVAAEDKTPLAIIGNIHGGERETVSCTMYTAWWMLLNSEDPYVKGLLDHYILYIIPSMNPDGYEQSFVNNNRPNMHPTDRNKDGRPFSDPYTDVDGDGYIATLYRGTAEDDVTTFNPWRMKAFGTESPDWDKNGVLGDDPHSSTIDMNRTFNYMAYRCDIDSETTIGANSWSSTGAGNYMPGTEPEVEAIQRFLYANPVYALITVHTGIQCVLYPWCYRPYDAAEEKDAEIPFMKETSEKMAAQFQETTGRGFYTKSSYEDYPTSGEMIDWAYGRLGIHAYTVEVYQGGKSADGNIEDCYWENELPEEKWVFYTQDQLKEMGLDPATITDSEGNGLRYGEGLWFYTSSTAQMVDKAPEDQETMVKGFLDCALVMIHSEPNGDGPQVPRYYK